MTITTATENQWPLQEFQLFQSQEIDEAAGLVGDIFCPHRLSVSKKTSRLDARMHHARVTDHSSLNFLHYGPEVKVEPGVLQDFFSVQIQLSGHVRTTCGDQTEDIGAGNAGMLSANHFVSMDWQPNSSMLIYRMDRQLVERKLGALLGSELDKPLVFETKMNTKEKGNAAWLRAAQFLLNELENDYGFVKFPGAAENFEENLVLSLLHCQTHNYSKYLEVGNSKLAPAHVKRVEAFIRENAGGRITIETLTEVAQVSARSLFAAFSEFRGVSPMKYLQGVRLGYARNDFLNPTPETTVTNVAMKWGFVQLGRFSATYRNAFGETPSQTLRNSRTPKIFSPTSEH